MDSIYGSEVGNVYLKMILWCAVPLPTAVLLKKHCCNDASSCFGGISTGPYIDFGGDLCYY